MAEQTTSKATGWKKWLREIAFFSVLLTGVTVAADLWRSQSVPDDVPFTLKATDIHGQPVDLAALSQDQPVLVYYWATWCGVCRFVTPSVNWLSQYYPTVGISLSSGPDEKLQRYFEHKALDFPNVNDPNNVLGRQWGVAFTPTIFIVRDGKVESITSGITTPMGMLARLWLA
ncbi:protein disulfide oxidoreductase [Photobacterium sp. GJ3]|uniref:protein disulfide oxidoreductase n=1 Tax=Photobacterium sp. GJ3 TaxID=2829502 RepID=UPI001B8C2CAF|nr:protein disulfide oxidoreductase [Photobacterium sp. GJ3]QUJ66207.1 protein disulfide oxidoreductase [Photobacterium sp. GJ3]